MTGGILELYRLDAQRVLRGSFLLIIQGFKFKGILKPFYGVLRLGLGLGVSSLRLRVLGFRV